MVMASAAGTSVDELQEEVDWVLALGELPLECNIADAFSSIQRGLFAALAGVQAWEGLVQRIADKADAPLVKAWNEAASFRELRQALTTIVVATQAPSEAFRLYMQDILMFPAKEATSVVSRFPPTSDLLTSLSLRRVLVQIHIVRATRAK